VNGTYSTSVSQAGDETRLLALINDLAAREGSLAPRAGCSRRNAGSQKPMLSAFIPQPQGLARFELRAGAAIPGEAIWLDLIEPTPSEERQVEISCPSTCRPATRCGKSRRRTASTKRTAACT
jgi:hypothetical protein